MTDVLSIIELHLQRYPALGVHCRATADGLCISRGAYPWREELHITPDQALVDAYAKLHAWLEPATGEAETVAEVAG